MTDATASGTPTARSWKETARTVARAFVTIAMVIVGVMHFKNPEPFTRIVPQELPEPKLLVYVSGVFEILLGLAIQIPKIRRLAGWGLVALYVAVFPANINMAVRHIELTPGEPIPDWVAWGRLPFQIVFIALAIWVTGPHFKRGSERRDPALEK
ncbi:MAG: DoxX family membrane protein [Polyangiaceae bacterium]